MNYLGVPVLIAAATLVSTPAFAADVAAGKALAMDACVDCHGDDGKGDDENPDITGMTVEKFTKAMQEYQAGTRTKSAKMTKAAKKLTAAQIADVAAYYATLK
ncbi:MAG TPA: c-type cytochrome [Steroidobacteraceae bacterium]|nr:c-type cytochrome [Steroidobacteraceae bacterium]